MRRISLSLFALFAILSFAVSVDAAAIVWGPATGGSADTDVNILGSLDRAFNFCGTGGSSATVNGVIFAPFAFNAASVTIGNTTLASNGGFNGDNTAFGSASAPFSSLSAGYQTLLQSAAFGNTGDIFTLTLNGLTLGQQYLFEWWVNASAAGVSNRTVTGTATNAVTLDENVQNTDGGIGQFATGTFTADATSQVITFLGGTNGPGPAASTQINGFQLRAIPEPSTIALLLFGGAAVLHRFARRK